MAGCCASGACDAATATRRVDCPVTGNKGARVARETVKALLTEAALRRLETGEYRFCADAACEVVYFDEEGRTFTTADIRVPVWQKEAFGDRTICYCFGENESDIRHELERDGRSHAVDRVRAHIQAGRCACELRNPRGTCCLGDVTAAVKQVVASLKVNARS